MERRQRPRVLLIREAAQQMSSSGCCGRIEGDAVGWGSEGCVFPERRAVMERVGVLYRALRERYGAEVDVQIVDPRNAISWLPMAVADQWRWGHSLRPLPALLTRIKTSGVIINGRLAFQELPAIETLFNAVDRVLTGVRP